MSERMCKHCGDEMWVCEDHPECAWGSGDGCCGAAGMPCPDCNVPPPGLMPMAEPGVRLVPNLTGVMFR